MSKYYNSCVIVNAGVDMNRPRPARVPKATFTNAARRAQIVESAIDTIAELGYAGASFARIARRAGLSSTRLISYHFAEKDDLMREVLHTVVARFTDYVRPRAEGEDSPRRRLIAALEANVDFIAGHRRDVVTLHEIERNYRTADGRPVLQQQAEDDLQTIASWLREGQRQGELREFDPDAVAVL